MAVSSNPASAPPAASMDLDTDPAPSLDELRAVLRPADLPLPRPLTMLEAAGRVMDLLHAGRRQQAQRLAETAAALPGEDGGRIALSRARLAVARAGRRRDHIAETAGALVDALHRAGHRQEAAATAAMLAEIEPLLRPETQGAPGQAAPDRTAPAERAGTARRSRHRTTIDGQVLAVVRGLLVPAPSPQVEPRRQLARLQTALQAAPAVATTMSTDPRPLLQLRLAQMLDGAGQPGPATTAALDALEAAEEAGLSHGAPVDPERVVASAHAVLARTLRPSLPVQAARHATEALARLGEIDDPPLRIGLITDLLQALAAAGLPEHATATAERLHSLLRTLPETGQRIVPLLAVASQRIDAGQLPAALAAVDEARSIARDHRDRRGLLECARLAASAHQRTGDAQAQLRELRAMAAQARWLTDDLATPRHERGPLLAAELGAQALIVRRCLAQTDRGGAEAAAAQILRRTGQQAGTPLLPAPLLWDHRVDALVGRLLALRCDVEQARARTAGAGGPVGASAGAPGVTSASPSADGAGPTPERAQPLDRTEDAARHRQVEQAIAEAPAGHEERAQYWREYLAERDAALEETLRSLQGPRDLPEG